MSNPFVSDTLNPHDFRLYDHVDGGVIIIKKDKRATIVYVNKHFAAYLSTTPNLLINRSLDSIAINQQPHYIAAAKFSKSGTKIGRKMRSGRSVQAVVQQGPKRGRTVGLTVWRMENHKDYMLGYARCSTLLEQFIEAASLSPLVDALWKPAARFFLAGKYRPFITSLVSVTLPILLAKHPVLLDVVQSLFPFL